MTQNLEELREKLYKAFDRAIARSEYYATDEDVQAQSENAAAALAKAIVAVETRLDARNQDKNGIKLPGKP
ncbi:MAG: hypothetical protein EPN97_17140 [Alphaproteobacteria bacterium]|nr:MAG: hypothetical protein EPN97_17140 [Alphaproteobacteria bacterium]